MSKRESKKKRKIKEKEDIVDEKNEQGDLSAKSQKEQQNKILKRVLVGLGGIAVFFMLVVLIANSMKHFEYESVDFEKQKYCDAGPCITVYRTSIPVNYKDKTTGRVISADYNFYLRNNPQDLEDVNFNGELFLAKNAVINSTESFSCSGDGIIGIANLVKLYNILGIEVIKDENATCDSEGRYMFIQIQSGDITEIRQTGPLCYTINVNNCEILKATEKMMLETLIKVNNVL